MPTFVVRVWVPDRPGALGAVASRIGSVRGDLVGIDILERGGGRAIDELVVQLPDAGLVPLLTREVAQVDGVDVEDVRAVTDAVDPRLDALETAAHLVTQDKVSDLLTALAARSTHDLEADWAAVMDLHAPLPVVSVGPLPPAPWLAAFVSGSRVSMASGTEDAGPDDVIWADLGAADLVVVLGRKRRPFRARERRQLTAVGRIADHRWSELVTRPARALHPSAS